ncbi:MAG: flagellar protein FlaG [Lachnospiraceae bacterium]|nr:flagellar protein FlaG [Lachnospiraceae bacterium]
MAVEPIGTMTAMQMQSTVRVQPISTQREAENMDVISADSATPKIDKTTAEIAKASESDTQEKKKEEQERENTKAENDAIKKAVENINKMSSNNEAIFGIHEGTNRVTIKIVDKDTKKVIKELPPEKTLDMIAKMWEMAGILVDEKR